MENVKIVLLAIVLSYASKHIKLSAEAQSFLSRFLLFIMAQVPSTETLKGWFNASASFVQTMLSPKNPVESIFVLNYKGFKARVEIDNETQLMFVGWGSDNIVTFQGETLEEAQKAFYDAVDEYLDRSFLEARASQADVIHESLVQFEHEQS